MDEQNNVQQKDKMNNDDVISGISKKKKPNYLAIALGVIAMVCAGLAVFFGIEYFKPNDNNKDEQNGSEIKETVIEQEGENTVINDLNMAKEYKEVKDLMNGLAASLGGSTEDYANSNGLSYIPEGLNSYVPIRYSIRMNLRNLGSSEADLATIQSKLEEAGFTAIGNLPHMGSTGPIIAGYLNSNNVVCGVESDYSQVAFALECAKTDWTWLTDEERSLIKELEEAYHEKTGQYPTIVYGFESKPVDSSVAPYQTLRVAIGGGFGLFYRVSPEAKWQFFAEGQASPNCDAYNTEDLRKAFAGSTCYNDSSIVSESVVQP